MSFNKNKITIQIKSVPIDLNRSKSLIKSSNQAIQTAKIINLNPITAKSIFRELYESLREFCEAIGYSKGYKFSSHFAITLFIKDILNEETISLKFDRYRKLRNKINYYGHEIDIETVKSALIEMPKIIIELKKYYKL